MLQKNSEYEGIVSGLGTEGEGIINIEGATVFVPFCLYGERVRYKVLKVKGNIAYGKLLKVIEPSKERREPVCKVFGKCGGCDLQHMSYTAQLEFKRNSVKSALKKIGGIDTEVDACVPCESELRYRNKLVLPIGEDDEGKVIVGFYARRSHRIVPAEDCAIQSGETAKIISCVSGFARGTGAYNEATRKGALRKFVVREVGKSFIFVLVTAKRVNVEPLLKSLKKSFESFTLVTNINKSEGNAVFGDEWITEYGSGFFGAEENGIKFTAGANTFLQVNDGVRKKLYDKALSEADGGVAVNLYSGAGMLTAMLAKVCEAAYGVEINSEASRCADELKRENNLTNMYNILGAAEEKIAEVFSLTEGKKRVVICDPPRKGMERSVVRAIAESGADKVILISCNPSTLARDLGLLCGTLKEVGGELKKEPHFGAYEIKSVTPFDMFPQTKWCETLVVLSRKMPEGR